MRHIDVHIHMLERQWLEMLKARGGPRYSVKPLTSEVEGIFKHGAHFMTPMPGHFDYDLRVKDMDDAGIMVLANIAGRHLTEAAFAPIWKAVDDKGLAVCAPFSAMR